MCNTPDDRDVWELKRQALEGAASVAARMRAVDGLIAAYRQSAKAVLLEIAARHDDPMELLRSAGEKLGRLTEGGLVLTEFDTRDMSTPAFDAVEPLWVWNGRDDPGA